MIQTWACHLNDITDDFGGILTLIFKGNSQRSYTETFENEAPYG